MKRFLLATLLAAAGFNANAVVMDFNQLTGSGIVSRGSHYEEDGFQLDATGSFGFGSIQSNDYRYDDSVSFFNNTPNGITTLTKIGGGVFSLDTIDLDSLNEAAKVDVTFIGTHLDGTTATVTFTTNNSFPDLQKKTFDSSFDNVVSVSWAQKGSFHSFDNIVAVAAIPPAQVPEPGTVAMLGLGLLAFTAARRKSAKK